MMNLNWGRKSSLVMAMLTIITFVVAMFAVPISGTFAEGGGLGYPYLDTLGQFPKDYFWMPLATILMCVYYLVFTNVHYAIEEERKFLSKVALGFAGLASGILIANYFVQIAVVPVNLKMDQMDGISLITQYNPYGLFIALEELGYLLMSLSFLFIGFSFERKSKGERFLKYSFTISSILAFIAFVGISLFLGDQKLDLFEVIVILINWLVLIVNGFVMSRWFKDQIKGQTSNP